jgi:hypothetical protein
VTVTKVVFLVLRIPEHLSLYFSNFYMILCVFYKFASFDSSVHVRFSHRPLDFCFFSGEVPGGRLRTEQGRLRRFPVRRVTDGEGKVGGKDEELECYLLVVLARRERAGGGGSAERGGWRWV